MNQNIKDHLEDNTPQENINDFFMKQKEYNTPTITNIGMINKMTLNGGSNPLGDSGTPFIS